MGSGDHLNKNYAESPQVNAVVYRFTEQLLGSHIGQCSTEGNGLGGADGGDNACKPKIDDLRNVVFGDDDVRWFDIAMNDIARVSSSETPCNLDCQGKRFGNRNRPSLQLSCQ